jgi:hypothetical protein
VVAVVRGLSHAVCAPEDPMPPARAHELLATVLQRPDDPGAKDHSADAAASSTSHSVST